MVGIICHRKYEHACVFCVYINPISHAMSHMYIVYAREICDEQFIVGSISDIHTVHNN